MSLPSASFAMRFYPSIEQEEVVRRLFLDYTTATLLDYEPSPQPQGNLVQTQGLSGRLESSPECRTLLQQARRQAIYTYRVHFAYLIAQSPSSRCPSIFIRSVADKLVLSLCLRSGSGSVDFQEFVAGLSAFSNRGEREEKLKCTSPPTYGQ